MSTRWDPYAEMLSLREAMGQLLNDSVVRPSAVGSPTALRATLPFDMYETADEVVVRVAIPGAVEDSIELNLHQGMVTLTGTRHFYSGDQEQEYRWHARGLTEGPFQFVVVLPTQVNAEAAQAAFDGGILTITLPKAETVKPKRIAVKGAASQHALTAGTS